MPKRDRSNSAEAPPPAKTAVSKAAALKASVAARLALAKSKLALKKTAASTIVTSAPAKKAQNFDIDFSNTTRVHSEDVVVIKPEEPERSKPKPSAAKPVVAKESNPYLAFMNEEVVDEGDDYDRKYKSASRDSSKANFKFVVAGQITESARQLRMKEEEIQKAGYASGRKVGRDVVKKEVKVKAAAVIEQDDSKPLPPAHELLLRHPSIVEWWDIPLLPADSRASIAAHEKSLDRLFLLKQNLPVSACSHTRATVAGTLSLSNSSTFKLVQHPVPVKPLGWDPTNARPPTVYLTEKERKRQRRLKRAAALQEVRDKQALGIVAAPEAKLTMANYMKVIGDSAVLDPSKMEAMVRKQIAGRLQKHLDDNEQRKLTPVERKAKKERKKFEDTEKTGVALAAFYVVDLTHRYHRTKLDLFAQQNTLTGVACTDVSGGGVVVVVEGGPKAMRRMERFMNVRMKWTGEGLDEISAVQDEAGEGRGEENVHQFNPNNYCTHLWSGMAVQRKHTGFKFEEEDGIEACKIAMDKGGKGHGYFWDSVGAEGAVQAAGGGGWDSSDDDEDAMQE